MNTSVNPDPSVILVTGSKTMVEQKMTEAYALGLKHALQILADSSGMVEAAIRIENLKNKQDA